MDLSEFKTRDEKTQYLKLSLGGVSSSISKRSNFLRSSISACNAAPSNGKFTAIEEAIKRLMDAKEKAHARYDALAELCPNDSESYEDKSIEISEKIGVLIDEADRAIVQGKEALTSTSSHASVTKEDNPRQPSQEDIIARSRKIAEEI
ncbi:Hypothetical protein FKW44_008857 [Caligus rogercresseyi]|uniref:Uncharacterized protein n=1 Tax=Caligus rogercresseyi TaxID=217165 RepID=A0A7T8KGN7_CALRO|nr:Hypothetical protein FKW44_008857 [Caligus rogercresseyi]